MTEVLADVRPIATRPMYLVLLSNYVGYALRHNNVRPAPTLSWQVQVKVQYSDPAGSFLHTSSAKQVSVVLRHGHRPGTAEIDINLPKAVRACTCFPHTTSACPRAIKQLMHC